MRLSSVLHLTLLLVGVGAPRADRPAEIELERLIWANPALSGLRAAWTSDPSGRALRVRAPDSRTADLATAFLREQAGLERFQVAVDPRLPVPPPFDSMRPPDERLRAAANRDPGTRELAAALDEARWTPEGVLELSRPSRLEAGLERRFVRLLLAQPGVRALRWSGEGEAVTSTATSTATSAPATAAATSDEPNLRAEPEPPARPAEAGEPLQDEGADEVDVPNAPPEPPDLGGALEALDQAATDAAAASRRRPDEARAPLDLVIEDFLAEALALEGAPPTVHVEVVMGVASFSGEAESGEQAASLRELTRNFDGVRRVTGRLRVRDRELVVPMDALPD